MKEYLEYFGRKNVHIILFEDFSKNTLAAVQAVFDFLGVRSDFVPELKVSNPGGVPRSKALHRFLIDPRIRLFGRRYLPDAALAFFKDFRSSNLSKTKMTMTAEERAAGYAFFEDDIRRTQDLIGMDLSHWLRA